MPVCSYLKGSEFGAVVGLPVASGWPVAGLAYASAWAGGLEGWFGEWPGPGVRGQSFHRGGRARGEGLLAAPLPITEGHSAEATGQAGDGERTTTTLDLFVNNAASVQRGGKPLLQKERRAGRGGPAPRPARGPAV